MKLWQILRGRTAEVTRYTLDEYLADLASPNRLVSYGSSAYTRAEDIETNFCSYVQQMYKSNGVIFAVILARLLLFTEARFCWFEVGEDGENGKAAGRDGLEVLDAPWPNGGTGELLARMEQDVSLGGNVYVAREPTRLRRLRPDWLTIVLTAPPAEAVASDVAGYWYHPGRSYVNVDRPLDGDELYLPSELCHWSPIPDPEAQYRGMSWLTPVVQEVLADKAATTHKGNFFSNGATLGPIVSSREALTKTQFEEWRETILGAHEGVGNAYRPLFLASPVDVAVRTADMKQLDFKVTQGAGETRIAAAGGVPPIIVGLSEGLASATYSNYGMARRKFGDHWATPQWRSASQALSTVVASPPRDGLRLGVNTAGIAFLREDEKDAAAIDQIKASTIVSLATGGFTRKSAIEAVTAGNMSLLVEDPNWVSVQLQQAAAAPAVSPNGAEPAVVGGGGADSG